MLDANPGPHYNFGYAGCSYSKYPTKRGILPPLAALTTPPGFDDRQAGSLQLSGRQLFLPGKRARPWRIARPPGAAPARARPATLTYRYFESSGTGARLWLPDACATIHKWRAAIRERRM